MMCVHIQIWGSSMIITYLYFQRQKLEFISAFHFGVGLIVFHTSKILRHVNLISQLLIAPKLI